MLCCSVSDSISVHIDSEGSGVFGTCARRALSSSFPVSLVCGNLTPLRKTLDRPPLVFELSCELLSLKGKHLLYSIMHTT